MRTNKTALNMEVLGINQIGDESYNATFTQTRTLAWLQDTPEQSVWKNWGVTYRDVRILDAQNKVRFVYNLSAHDLSLAENRAALTQMLLSAAEAADSDQDGLLDDWEILNFGSVAHTGVEDPDVDGATNLAEFAFGTNPNDPGSLVPLRMVTVQAATASFSFRRRLGSLLDYVLETSSDLKEWGPAAPEWVSLQAPRNLFDGTGTAEVVGTLTRTASEPLRFLRVRATGKP